jgi:Tfp pilus assembly protein PilP
MKSPVEAGRGYLEHRPPRALLEDSSGKGYIISKGSFIGKNQGKVTDILKDEMWFHRNQPIFLVK